MSSAVVNESLVRRIMEDSSINQLGCLKDRKVDLTKKRGCGKCGKKRAGLSQLVATTPSLTWVKRCLYGMTEDALQKVKTSLSVDRLVFYFNEPGLPQRVVR
jgi:hypothetical protein